MRRYKLLVLMKHFANIYPKHKHKYDMIKAFEEYMDVVYWSEDGDIRDILRKIPFKPDFIFHGDIAWLTTLTPVITGLNKVSIPKGCFVNDIHFSKSKRLAYFEKNKIDLIFATYRAPFMKKYPQYRKKHRWLPFSVNTEVIRDWQLKKDIRFLLMGQVYYRSKRNPAKRLPPKGRYRFREAVLEKLKDKKGFVFNPHPGHLASPSPGLMVNENYARELNRAKMFFTCGGEYEYAVAKFFEAPGCRTLLLAKPNRDILDLGFRDGVNFVACNEQNVHEKAMYYLEHKNERNRITDQGYEFILGHHTNSVRARQFTQYVDEYLRKNGK